MARNDEKKEIQHYVPRMLLRNFAHKQKSKQEKIHVFDKRDGRSFFTGVGNIVAERSFYDIDFGDRKASFEPSLSELEEHANGVIQNLLVNKNLADLKGEEKTWLGLFVACQMLRTKNFREMIKENTNQLFEKVKRMSEKEVHEIKGLPSFKDEKELQNFATYFMIDNVEEFSSRLFSKDWVLLETKINDPFLLGDNPVTLHNSNKFGVFGNLGLALKGIQIHLPLAPTLTLAMWCPSIIEKMYEGQKTMLRQKQDLLVERAMNPNSNYFEIDEILKKVDEQIKKTAKTLSLLETNRLLPSTSDNVLFYNSLQIQWADRYMLSFSKDFSLVKRMIKDSTNNKRGIRFNMG